MNIYPDMIQLKKPNDAYYLKGGSVFDGQGFSKQDWYVVDGLFTKVEPTGPLKELDLAGKFIVPPYGDAHCHHIDGAFLAKRMNDQYLSEGTLYVQSMGNHTNLRVESDTVVNRPNSIDVAYANAGLTSEFGHPAFLYEALAHPTNKVMTPKEKGEYIRSQPRLELGNAYWLVENEQQLEEIWPKYLASDPDLLKVFLVNSKNRVENFTGLPGTIGLDPVVLPNIVKKAHQSGLKVYAHVDTSFDFDLAMKSGVDGTAHMPGYGMNNEPVDWFTINLQTAKLAKGRTIQPTISLVSEYSKGSNLPAAQAVQSQNARLLRNAGATFVIGSDFFLKTEKEEVEAWKSVGFDNVVTLR